MYMNVMCVYIFTCVDMRLGNTHGQGEALKGKQANNKLSPTSKEKEKKETKND